MNKLQSENIQVWIGRVLKRLRGGKGWSQSEFAANAGVDRRYMSDVELGKRNVSIDVLNRIAKVFEMNVSDLLAMAEREVVALKTLDELKEWLCSQGLEDAVVFECPDYLTAVIGVSEDGRVIYSYQQMVSHLIEFGEMDAEEATEFIDYNTIRALPYMGEKAPVICYEII